jgi:hypothetical protein
MAACRYLALALVSAALVPWLAGCTGASSTAVSLGLSVSEIAVGDTCRANVTVTDSGAPMPGVTVIFDVSPSTVATMSAATATADSTGHASIAITGVAPGTAHVQALAHGRASEVRTLTVLGPAVPEHVLFLGGADASYQVVPNAAGNTTPTAAPLGGARWVMGAQRAGSLVLAIPNDVAADTAWVRDLHTGTEAEFGYANFRPLVPLLGPRTAAINSSGTELWWIQSVAGSTQVLHSNVDGSEASVTFASPTSAEGRPLSLVLTPDDSTLAFTTADKRLYRISASGAGVTEMSLGGSAEPTAIWWLDNTTLLVAVRYLSTTELPGIVRLTTSGAAPEIVYDNGGAGMRSAPFTLTTDWQSNILFDEHDASGTNTDIYRLAAPGYATEEAILARTEVDGYPTIVNY